MSRAVRSAVYLLSFSAFLYTLSTLGPISISVNVPEGLKVNLDGNFAQSSPPQYYAPPPQQDSSPQRDIPSSPPPKKNKSRYDSDPTYRAILNAITSFSDYAIHARDIIDRRFDKYTRLRPEHLSLAKKIGYNKHFEKAEPAIDHNSVILRDMADASRPIYGPGFDRGELSDYNDYDIVADFLAHIVRDWSAEGAEERKKIFPPIIEALDRHIGDKGGKVLVPGFGLGRLAHEIAKNPKYTVDGNELDYGCLIPYYYILNASERINQHTLYPFVTKFTHQLTANARFDAIKFPDELPTSPVTVYEGDWLSVFEDTEFEGAYDAIVTLFFIDISENVIDFFEQIHRLLKPGGVWINLGPFKWDSYSNLQLSAEEAVRLADLVGFDVDPSSQKSIDAVYGHQPSSLLKFTYVTQFWTAKRRLF